MRRLKGVIEDVQKQGDMRDFSAEELLKRVEGLEIAVGDLERKGTSLEEDVLQMKPKLEDIEEKQRFCDEFCPERKSRELSSEFKEMREEALGLLKSRNPEKSLEIARKKMEQFRLMSEYWRLLHYLYRALGDEDRALDAAHKAIEMGSDTLEYRCDLISSLFYLGKTDELISEAGKVFREFEMRECGSFLGYIGYAVRHSGTIDDIDVLLQDIIESEVKGCPRCFGAYLYHLKNEDEKALSLLEEDDIDCEQSGFVRAVILDSLERNEEARKLIDDTDFPKAGQNALLLSIMQDIIYIYDQPSDCDRLSTLAERIQNVSWSMPEEVVHAEYERMALVMLKLGCEDKEQTLALARKALEHHDCPSLRIVLIRTYLELGKSAEAKEHLEIMSESFPDSPQSLLEQTEYYSENDDIPSLERTVKKIMTSDPILSSLESSTFVLQRAKNINEKMYKQLTDASLSKVREENPEDAEKLEVRLKKIQSIEK